LRLVREEEWLVRFEPVPPRLMGDDPVPVVIEADDVARAETGAVRLGAFASAWPHASQ
jgi:hypothetical protein